MSYALQRVAEELRAEIDELGIEVPVGQRVIVMPDRAVMVKPYSTTRECRKVLRECIKELRVKKEQADLENQATLF